MILLTDTYDCLGKAIWTRLQPAGRWGGIRVVVPPDEYDRKEAPVRPGCFESRTNDTLFPDRMLDGIDIVIMCTSNIWCDQRTFFRTLIRAARGQAVRHLIFVSSILAKDVSAKVHRECRETEMDIHCSGIPYTILRTNILMEHLSFFIGNPCESRTIYYPAGDGKINFVSSADVAEVIYRLLLENDGSENRIYTLSHPEGYSFREIALKLSQLKHIDISYETVDVGLYRDALFQTLLPTDTILRLCSMAECVRQNKYNIPDDTLLRLLGVSVPKKRDGRPLKNWFYRREAGRSVKSISDYLAGIAWNKVCDFS